MARTQRALGDVRRRGFAAGMAALALVSGGGGVGAQVAPDSATQVTALVGATLYASPDEAPVRDAVVLITDGRIDAVGTRGALRVPEGASVIDGAGGTILAGFWNSHVHFLERKWGEVGDAPADELSRQLEDMLTRFGFTSVFDLSSDGDNTRRLRARIESGEVRGPSIRTTGTGLIPAGGRPPDTTFRLMGLMPTALPEIAEAEQAGEVAQRLLDEGVDGIKLFVSSQSGATLVEGAIEAAVDRARRRGKPVFAHPNSGADVLAALRGGVDVIVHTTPAAGSWSAELLAELRAVEGRSVALTPTLKLWHDSLRHDRISEQELVTDTAVGQLRAWIAAGGEVLYGSDLGAVDYDPGTEYALMAAAGMDFRGILASLTTTPAARFGEGQQRGRVAPGYAADLVVVDGDPATDWASLTRVQYTLRDGALLYRAP